MDLTERVFADAAAVFPEFPAYWAENGPDFFDEAGGYTACGVLLILARLVQERATGMSPGQWRRLAALARTHYDDEPARGLVGACLIDPLERPPAEGPVRRYFDRDMLRHYHFAGTVPVHSRGELLGAAWEVARNFRAYGQYGAEVGARRALARRRPGFTPLQYANALQNGLRLLDAAEAAVARRAAAWLRQTDVAAVRFPDFRGVAGELRRKCPGFPAATYRAAVAWAYDWHHLR